MNTRHITLTVVGLLGCINALAQNIPLDPQLRTGKLSNGFTYYIRRNAQPQKHVELYLVNKVGSILEDEDQRGLAHFLEHMNFNGTTHYPKNELVDYLQKIGVRFGADLNAYTGFDETVYQLPLPTDDPAMLGKGLSIMRDWAQEATLDPAEIDKERGIVLEEERLGKGAKDRIIRQELPVLLNHSRYADRMPIGKDEVLKNFSPAVIKRFHHDWYRPNLQALIIVGDVDVNETEQLVKARFGDLKNPQNEKVRPRYTVPLTGKNQYIAVRDKEETSTTLEIVMKHQAPSIRTEQDYFSAMKRNLLNDLIGNRQKSQLSREQSQAFTEVNIGITTLMANLDCFNFQLVAKEGMLKQAFAQSWRVLEGIRRYGFSEEELDRARRNYLSRLESMANEQGKIPSVNYVKEYQQLFLKDEIAPGHEWEYRFSKEQLGKISLKDITALLDEYLGSKDVDILITAPQKDKTDLPDQDTVNAWITTICNEDIKPFNEQKLGGKTLLATLPTPGKVISKKEIPQIGVTKLTLSNGVTVILKPTDFKNDQIVYQAFSRGGASLYNGADYDMAVNAGGLVASMGLGAFMATQLDQVVAGKNVRSSANINLRSEVISGSATVKDIETALQLTYLQFTAPGKDTVAFKNAMDKSRAGLANRYSDPGMVFSDTVSYMMSNYNYRFAPLTEARINAITLKRTYEIFKERFSDASNFTFVFVGNFKLRELEPLLERYLGALPSSYRHTQSRDLGIHIPKGRLTRKVYKGLENKATVKVVLSGDFKVNPQTTMALRALADILQIKVLQRLREGEGEIYSPQVVSGYNKYPRNRFMIVIQFGCAPQNVDHLVALLEDEMRKLRENGPDLEDIEKFKAQYRKTTEPFLKENNFWSSYLASQCENKEDLLQVLHLLEVADGLDQDRIIRAAQTFLSGENMIRFELLPEVNTK